jgi:hypothetical protein
MENLNVVRYFRAMGWRLSRLDGPDAGWEIKDPDGCPFLPQLGPLRTEDAVWQRWSLLARRRLAEEQAADLVVEAIDLGFLPVLDSLRELRNAPDPTGVLQTASRHAMVPGGATLPTDWKIRAATACRGKTLMDLDAEIWFLLVPAALERSRERTVAAAASLAASIPHAQRSASRLRL